MLFDGNVFDCVFVYLVPLKLDKSQTVRVKVLTEVQMRTVHFFGNRIGFYFLLQTIVKDLRVNNHSWDLRYSFRLKKRLTKRNRPESSEI